MGRDSVVCQLSVLQKERRERRTAAKLDTDLLDSDIHQRRKRLTIEDTYEYERAGRNGEQREVVGENGVGPHHESADQIIGTKLLFSILVYWCGLCVLVVRLLVDAGSGFG